MVACAVTNGKPLTIGSLVVEEGNHSKYKIVGRETRNARLTLRLAAQVNNVQVPQNGRPL